MQGRWKWKIHEKCKKKAKCKDVDSIARPESTKLTSRTPSCISPDETMRKLIGKTWKFQKYVEQFSAKRQSSKRHNGNGSDGMSHLDQFIINGKRNITRKIFSQRSNGRKLYSSSNAVINDHWPSISKKNSTKSRHIRDLNKNSLTYTHKAQRPTKGEIKLKV